jgi:hypothetical protein
MNTSIYFIGDTVTLLGSRDGAVGTASRLRAGHPKNRCSIPGRAKSYVSSSKCPDWILGFLSVLFNAER